MKEIPKKIVSKAPSDKLAEKPLGLRNAKAKKFLAVFDGFKFSKSTLDYAIHLTKETDAFLVGVFLDDFIYRSYNAAEIISSQKSAPKLLFQMAAKDKLKRDASVKEFETACTEAGIHFTVHRNEGIAIQELKQESIFADLIIINENETFNRFTEKSPTRFIKELLGDIQCPVLTVPNQFNPIDKITFLYDGGPSSVFAIKMFSYLFNNRPYLPVEVFTVKDKMDGAYVPNNKLMREFIKRHFPKAKYIVGKGNAEDQVLKYLQFHKGNDLVVLGAYRRSEISRWFKTSMADILMKELDTPLFIAHNK